VGEETRLRVVRAAERSRTTDPKSGVARESFGPRIKGSNVEFLRLVIPPSSIAGPFPPHPKGTIEHVHVASGSIRVLLGPETVTLGRGDSCTCLADAPHSFDNRAGKRGALLYVVVEPT
jgi:mannose-6-phosphate isomerase-like protein (cupin superfamily)